MVAEEFFQAENGLFFDRGKENKCSAWGKGTGKPKVEPFFTAAAQPFRPFFQPLISLDIVHEVIGGKQHVVLGELL